MEMFLMGAVLSLMGVAVSAALFAAATRQERAEQSARSRAATSAAASRFFVEASPTAPPPRPEAAAVDVEALLLRIEHHVRLEQAAAESFLHAPTPKSLHGRTASPLMH